MNGNKTLARYELVGLDVEIVSSKNKSLEGIKGEIIDETRNMLTMKTKEGKKKIIKSEVILKMKVKGKNYEVNGKILVGRPEERIKKIRRL